MSDNPYGSSAQSGDINGTSAYQKPSEETSYKKPDYSNNSGGGSYKKPNNSYGGGGSKSEYVVPDPVIYRPVAIHLARETPTEILEKLDTMARDLANKDFTIRANINNDAERVVSVVKPKFVEWSRPFKKFQCTPEQEPNITQPSLAVKAIAELITPTLRMESKRNAFLVQETSLIVGKGGRSIARLLITYSPDGMTDFRNEGKNSGFMAHIVRVAQVLGVPVINLANDDAAQAFGAFIGQYSNGENHE